MHAIAGRYIVVFCLLMSANASAQVAPQTSPPRPPARSLIDVDLELQRQRDQLAEVRRDQLNYQIERDLLKETYSSNLQTINLVLAIILAAFAALGYLGLRSLGTLRSQFQTDLDQFRAAKADLDRQVKELSMEQARASTLVTNLEAENKEQDRRLQSLELREKAGALIAQANFSLALEYLALGLEMTPNDTVMLRQRAHCLTKLGRLSDAIGVNETVLKLKPDDEGAVEDLAEFYLLANRVADSERIIATHPGLIEKRSPLLPWYFEAIKLLLKGDVEELTQHVRGLLSLTPAGQAPRIPTWGFQEVRAAFSSRQDLSGRSVFFRAIDFLEGRIDSSALFPAPQPPDAGGAQTQAAPATEPNASAAK